MKADLIERLRAHPNKFIGHWEDWADEAGTLMLEAADRIAAREAEASEGERRGLERHIIEIIEPKGDKNGVWCGSPLEAVIAVQNERDSLREALTRIAQEAERPTSKWPHLKRVIGLQARAALIPEAPVREGE